MRGVKLVVLLSACSVPLFCSVGTPAAAEDASIDRLLNKLPPPEKLIKPSVQKALEQPDPAFKDSLVTEIVRAATTRDFQQMLNLSRKLAERYPRSAGARCLQGVIAYDLRQFGEASASFRTAAKIQPAFTFAYFGMAAVESIQGHYASAIPPLQRVLELEPKAAVVYYYLSDCALRAARKQEGADYARKAAALAPSDADMWLQLAKAEKALGHNEATLNAIAKAAEVSPDSGLMLAILGFSYINLNRIPQAIPPLDRAAKRMPQDYLVHSQLGYCLMSVGQVGAAIDHLRKGASLNSSYGPVWEHLGVAYQKQGRHRDAVNALENATRLLPASRLAWHHLSQEYQATGRAADAQRAAGRAQQLSATLAKPGKKA